MVDVEMQDLASSAVDTESNSASASTSNLSTLLSNLEASLMAPTQHAAQLPSPSDLAFERTLSRPLGKSLDATSTHLHSLVSSLLRWVDPATTPSTWNLDGEMVNEGVYGDVVGKVEGLLEGADEDIEEALGIGKKKDKNSAVGAKSGAYVAPDGGRRGNASTKDTLQRLPASILNADIPKPQLQFDDVLYPPAPPLLPTNPKEPLWRPILETKPGVSQPFVPTVELFTPQPKSSTPLIEPPRYRYCHPFAAELDALSPPAHYYTAPTSAPTPKQPDSFDTTPFAWVDNEEGLVEMMREIEEHERKELAIDLEHHDLRSWNGLCSLIQLSTRSKDYVLDTLAPGLRPHLQKLNKFFADPSYVKVFHGAKSDIIWLQRDFGLYILGLFDTYHACVLLDFGQRSLASLLARYTSFVPDKRYQLADWRIRPLPKEMLGYARSDTHYLLDIYDHLRIVLLASGAGAGGQEGENEEEGGKGEERLEKVWKLSKRVSGLVHEIPPYDAELGLGDGGWRALLIRWRVLSTLTGVALPLWGEGEVNLEVLRALHEWREITARKEDESPRFVMTNEVMLKVIEAKPGKKEELGKLGVGEVGRRRSEELLAAVREGVERAAAISVSKGPSAVALDGRAAEGTAMPEVKPVTMGLWDMASLPFPSIVVAATSSSAIASTSSSFFGAVGGGGKPMVTPPPATPSVQTSSSSFFGASVGGIPSSSSSSSSRADFGRVSTVAEERRKAVERIHAGLVLGGGLGDSLKAQNVPVAVVEEQAAPADEATPIDIDVAPSNADHSFVPFSDRQTKTDTSLTASSSSVPPAAKAPNAKARDSEVLVVSSLADKPKKRRRAGKEAEDTSVAVPLAGETTAAAAVTSPVPRQKKGRKERAPVEAFDYSNHRSVLDAEPVVEGVKAGGKHMKGKGKGDGPKKGFELDTSEFKRQPRVQNASKKGNVSRSFAS